MRPEPDPFAQEHRFTAKLFRTEGKGGWTFVLLPQEIDLPVTGAWGMTPVIATVDGREWKTTVWRDKAQRCYLPVPKKMRAGKEAPAEVHITLRMDRARAPG
jgi:hypothetical protein